MLVIGTGSREFRSAKFIRECFIKIRAKYNMTEYYHGNAKGFDKYSEFVLRSTRFTNIRAFDADWNQYGASAGPIRNQLMIDTALTLYKPSDIVLVAFPLETSKGTYDCIEKAQLAYICVEVFMDIYERIDYVNV
jgi:hypothetical protein